VSQGAIDCPEPAGGELTQPVGQADLGFLLASLLVDPML
jgi:hypothetical protein